MTDRSQKITELTSASSVVANDVFVVVTDTASTPVTKKITVGEVFSNVQSNAIFKRSVTAANGVNITAGGLSIGGTLKIAANGDWVGAGGVEGAKGEKGDTGDKGDVGTTGVKGDKGDTGDKGDAGSAGDKGEIGDKGDVGDKGDKGDVGDKGDKGDTGSTGTTGDKGDKGDTGSTGDKGDTGAAGDKGDVGDKGDTGSTGDKGDKGDTGAAGDKGDIGDKGDVGDKGDKGDVGDKGDKVGDKGNEGDIGVKGDKGDEGPNLTSTIFGYSSGGAVTQTTSRNTSVVLNALTGEITTVAGSLAAGGVDVFSLNNNLISAYDMVLVTYYGASIGTYMVGAYVGQIDNQATIWIKNIDSSTSPNEAIIIKFLVVKAAVT